MNNFIKSEVNIEGAPLPVKGYTLDLPIFNFRIDLVVSDEIEGYNDCMGTVFHKEKSYVALVEFNKEFANQAVIHESVHLAQAVCFDMSNGDKGHSLTKDELLAYLTEYISSKIFVLFKKIKV